MGQRHRLDVRQPAAASAQPPRYPAADAHIAGLKRHVQVCHPRGGTDARHADRGVHVPWAVVGLIPV